MNAENIISQIENLLQNATLEQRVNFINEVRYGIHQLSPFKNEPIDFVKWELSDNVVANDYNPNKVAPPEMELLEISIMNDGYTQPIVSWNNPEKGKTEVIDGFHRNRVGKESKIIRQRVMGYLPVVDIRKEQADKNDRIASTIRHNRARGKHQINAMSEIVIELKNRNWSNDRIAKQLGMDKEEVLRLCQISGLEYLFSDSDFSKAWEAGDEGDFTPISDDVSEQEMSMHKIPNESDKSRIFHTYDKWECYTYGFYASKHPTKTKEECEACYVDLLGNPQDFKDTIETIFSEWKHSCEHYLTNKSMNRIAWLGQAAVCYLHGVPAVFSYSWSLLTDEQKEKANATAFEMLNKWLSEKGYNETSIDEAMIIGRQVELY